MLKNAKLTTLVAMILCSSLALAKAPASAPAGSTGMCKDGTYTSAASKSGACSGHDGIKKWYGVTAASSATTPAASSEKPASTKKTKTSNKSEETSSSATSPSTAAGSAAAATGTCKDGTSTSASSKSGACSGHGGVKDWYGTAGAAATATSTAMSRAAPAASTAPGSSAATGTCKDGTSTSAASRSGACSGHGGVKDWYAGAAATPAAAPEKTNSYTPPATPAPGGGAGQVWVNKPSKVYHCQNDQWYGKTKDGAYMSEADAVAQGYRADHGKACK